MCIRDRVTTPATASTPVAAPSSAGPTPSSDFPSSVFDRNVQGWPVDPNSAGFVNDFVTDYKDNYGTVGVNSMPIYSVPSNQAEASISVSSGCNSFLSSTGSEIPIPSYTSLNGSSDSPLIVWQPSTQTDWEPVSYTHLVPGPVAVPGTLMGQVCQPCHFGVTGRGGEGGQIGRHQLQVERTIPGEPGSGGHGTGVAGEPTGLLGTAAQVSAGRGRQPTVHVVQAASPSHGRHGGGQMAPTGMVIVDVIGRDNIGAQLTSELGQGVVAGTGQRLAMVPDLDGHIGPAEMALQAGQLVPGRGRAGIDQCLSLIHI